MSKVNETHLVGVYGTLRKGLHNHYLLVNSTYKGDLLLKSPVALYAGSALPFALLKEGGIHNLKLEVYEVTERVLGRLDSLEGHPDWYKRVKIPTSKGDLWIYMLPEPLASGSKMTYVQEGDWLEFDKKRSAKYH